MNQDGGGSFREVRQRHLSLFDQKLHRHDRGWPHQCAGRQDRPQEKCRKALKKNWKTVGILHFPAHHEEDEEDAEARNAGSC